GSQSESNGAAVWSRYGKVVSTSRDHTLRPTGIGIYGLLQWDALAPDDRGAVFGAAVSSAVPSFSKPSRNATARRSDHDRRPRGPSRNPACPPCRGNND